jgi:hypothetical protein
VNKTSTKLGEGTKICKTRAIKSNYPTLNLARTIPTPEKGNYSLCNIAMKIQKREKCRKRVKIGKGESVFRSVVEEFEGQNLQ